MSRPAPLTHLFGEEKWKRFFHRPDWYREVVPLLITMEQELAKCGIVDAEDIREHVHAFFEEKLRDGEIMLGTKVGHMDKDRQPIDTVVVHHTEHPPRMTKERLSVIGLLRLYIPASISSYSRGFETGIGGPISSGHVRDGKQVFYPYHWIVRKDGRVDRCLFDNEIGWHAGNWDANCRSIGIAIDNDHSNSTPSNLVLDALATLIRTQYSFISGTSILGHCEINPRKRRCPSGQFLSSNGVAGWKENLISRVFDADRSIQSREPKRFENVTISASKRGGGRLVLLEKTCGLATAELASSEML